MWKEPLNDGEVFSSPVVSGGTLYVATDGVGGTFDGHLFALDAATGAHRWRVGNIGWPGFSTEALSGGLVYLSSPNGALGAFDAVTGDLVWSVPLDRPLDASPVVANGVVFVGSADLTGGTLYAIDAVTGDVLFSHPESIAVGALMVDNGVVFETHLGDGTLNAYGLP